MPVLASAIIPAAGRGERLPGDEPKQYRVLGDIALLAWSVRALAAAKAVQEVIVGVDAEWLGLAREILEAMAPAGIWRLVEGGSERQDTVRNCLARVSPGSELVVIHDAARPFVLPGLIEMVIQTAARAGAASAAVRPTDTVKFEHLTRGVRENLDRDRLWKIQTPQAFKKELIVRAHEQAKKQGFAGTDDTVLVERIGSPVEIVRGSRFNLKITTAEDWDMAQALVAAGKVKPLELVRPESRGAAEQAAT